MRNLFSLFFLTLLWSQVPLYSQQNNFITYTAKDGLPVSTILAIAQDSRNYLWIGTEGGGICRFDGSAFRTFTTKDGLAGNIVRSIMEDTSGDLWIGTDNGISVYNGHEFLTIQNELDISGSSVIKLFEDQHRNIWAATDKHGLRKIIRLEMDSLKIEPFTTEHGLSSNYVFDIHEDKFGRLWLASVGGLDIMTLKDDTYSIYNFGRTQSFSNKTATSIAQDRNGFLWVGTMNSGVLKMPVLFNLDSIEPVVYDVTSGLNDNHIWNIVEDHTGQMWIATNEGGINLISKDGVKTLTKKQGLPSNQIYRLFQDREQNIWIGTYGSGLSKFLGNHFSHYNIDEQPGKYNISSVVEDHTNNLWMGTYGSGLIKMSMNADDPVFEFFTKDNGLAENDVSSIAIDQDENIWIGYSSSGIGKIGPSGIDHFTKEQGLIISNSVNSLFIDSESNLWCGTNGGISIYMDGELYTYLDKSRGLSSNKIVTIIEDSYGDIWIGSMNGLMRYDLSELTIYNEEEGLNDLKINSLVEDIKGNIWIGTFGGGLYKYHRFRSDSLLPIELVANDDIISSNNIFSLAFQNDSTLIVGTDKGFDRIFFDEEQNVLMVKRYDESNGFFGIENNLNALSEGSHGDFWFGTAYGLTRYNPDKEYINLKPPKTYITGIKIRYEDIDWKTRSFDLYPWLNLPVDLELPWSENHVTLQYTGVSLSNPEMIRYKYKLVGLDEDWSPSTTNHEVVYQNLNPGHYEFQVIAENENGIWIKNPTRFNFSISTPFWQQWWFYTLIILTTLFTALIWIRKREKQLIRKNRELESKVRKRTREITEQKEEIESQRDEIEAQRDEIVAQRDIVISQKQEITDSIYYAQRIQRAVLPHEAYMNAIMPEYFVIFKPRDIVSGDFYWVKEVNHYLIIVAADCTGHGVPGAFLSMLGITLLNELFAKSQFEKPGEILNHLRKKVKEIMAQVGKIDEQKDGMDMAIVIYDNISKELQFAGAYNPLYLVRKNTKILGDQLEPFVSIENIDYTLFALKGDRQPIGIYSIETEFTSHTLKLEEQDTFYIFSDGYVDQFGGEQRKKFKSLNFKKLLLSVQEESMEKQRQKIENTFETWRGHNDQIDDICVIGVKV